jgi:hypothetical protein
MKKLVLAFVLALGFTSSFAMAEIDYGLEVGTRQQSGDSGAGVATKSRMGMQFGVTGHMPISGALHLRTGMLYTERSIILQSTPENKVAMNYLDVPIALMFKFEEYAGVYLGISLALNLDKSAEVGTVTNVKSTMTPLLFGASFKFAPNYGLALYYESASGEVAKDLQDYRAVGANLMITFD